MKHKIKMKNQKYKFQFLIHNAKHSILFYLQIRVLVNKIYKLILLITKTY